MAEPEPYATAKGVEDAIKQAARAAAMSDPSLTTSERIRLEYFNRFLSRVFSDGHSSEWLLKGGTAMLARVPSSRATVDIDLYRNGHDLDAALSDLQRIAERDLKDHFRFVYAGHNEILAGDRQPNTDGYRVSFDTFIGAQKKDPIAVDLAAGAGLTEEPTVTSPKSALNLPRLQGCEYRLYPVVDQIADKTCATMELHRGRRSSREKDLVDLVVLAVTQDVDGAALGRALAAEIQRRRLDHLTQLDLPPDWGRTYAAMARTVPYCAGLETVDTARELVTRFINPALDGTADGLTWVSHARTWLEA